MAMWWIYVKFSTSSQTNLKWFQSKIEQNWVHHGTSFLDLNQLNNQSGYIPLWIHSIHNDVPNFEFMTWVDWSRLSKPMLGDCWPLNKLFTFFVIDWREQCHSVRTGCLSSSHHQNTIKAQGRQCVCVYIMYVYTLILGMGTVQKVKPCELYSNV